MERPPKPPKCTYCHKQLDEFGGKIVPGQEAYLEGYGSFTPCEIFCDECYEIRMGKGLKLSQEEIDRYNDELGNKGVNDINSIFKVKHHAGIISVIIKGEEFTFDNKSFDKFVNNFMQDWYDIDVVNGYLVRIDKKRKTIEYFHRWLFIESGDLFQFASENNLDISEVHVHHKYENRRDNRYDYLECKNGEEHFREHEEEWAWQSYRKEHTLFWWIRNREIFKNRGYIIPEEFYRQKFINWFRTIKN